MLAAEYRPTSATVLNGEVGELGAAGELGEPEGAAGACGATADGEIDMRALHHIDMTPATFDRV